MNRLGTKPFGANKYAAFNLLMAKWIRFFAISERSYCYVTLGGVNLHDLACLYWVDKQLVSKVISFESDMANYKEALKTQDRLRASGLSVEIRHQDIFEYRRESPDPHILFVDLPESLSIQQHQRYFTEWFEEGVVQPNDFVVITSTLQRGVKRTKVIQSYDADFRVLLQSNQDAMTYEDRNRIYEIAHPLFIMHSSLRAAGLNDEIMLEPVGSVKYRDKFNLGVYGIACREGYKDLGATVAGMSHFDMTSRKWDERFASV